MQLVLKSLNKGKSQGKSACGRLCMKTVSDWKRNKLSAKLKLERIKKKASFSSMLHYLNNIKTPPIASFFSDAY